MDVDKVGRKKTFSEWILFRVELIASSFPYLVSKQARLNLLTDCKGVLIGSDMTCWVKPLPCIN